MQAERRKSAFAAKPCSALGGAAFREKLRLVDPDRAEKLAAQAPTKMLGPLMLCIFPAVFIILLGPVLNNALKGSLF